MTCCFRSYYNTGRWRSFVWLEVPEHFLRIAASDTALYDATTEFRTFVLVVHSKQFGSQTYDPTVQSSAMDISKPWIQKSVFRTIQAPETRGEYSTGRISAAWLIDPLVCFCCQPGACTGAPRRQGVLHLGGQEFRKQSGKPLGSPSRRGERKRAPKQYINTISSCSKPLVLSWNIKYRQKFSIAPLTVFFVGCHNAPKKTGRGQDQNERHNKGSRCIKKNKKTILTMKVQHSSDSYNVCCAFFGGGGGLCLPDAFMKQRPIRKAVTEQRSIRKRRICF